MSLKSRTVLVPACLAFLTALACLAEEPLKEAVSVINVEVLDPFSGKTAMEVIQPLVN